MAELTGGAKDPKLGCRQGGSVARNKQAGEEEDKKKERPVLVLTPTPRLSWSSL